MCSSILAENVVVLTSILKKRKLSLNGFYLYFTSPESVNSYSLYRARLTTSIDGSFFLLFSKNFWNKKKILLLRVFFLLENAAGWGFFLVNFSCFSIQFFYRSGPEKQKKVHPHRNILHTKRKNMVSMPPFFDHPQRKIFGCGEFKNWKNFSEKCIS